MFPRLPFFSFAIRLLCVLGIVEPSLAPSALAQFPTTEEVPVKCPHPEDLRVLRAIDRLLSELADAGEPGATNLRGRIPGLRSRLTRAMASADKLDGQPLAKRDLEKIRSHNAAVTDVQTDVRAFLTQVLDRLVELGLKDKETAELLLAGTLAKLPEVNWVGKPSPVIIAAMDALVNDGPLPKDVKDLLTRQADGASALRFVWKGEVQRNLSNSIWALDGKSLAVSPAFQEVSSKAQLQLLTFELGKVLYLHAEQHEDKRLREFDKLSEQIPADLLRLPDVPQLGDKIDRYSRFGYAYYLFSFKKDQLRAKGLGSLVDQWGIDPPHAILKAR